MNRNLKIICILLIVITSVVVYEIRDSFSIADREKRKSIATDLEYIHQNSNILPKDFCKSISTILVMVHSRPLNFDARITIRAILKKEVTFFFLLGEVTNETLQMRISEEKAVYNDIIQGNFIDSYKNLTLKSMMGLELASRCINRSLYLLKSDDDTLINIKKMKEMLYRRNFPEDLLIGHLHCNVAPIRDPREKRYMPHYVYPDERYPRYLMGGSYLMSMGVVERLYQEALKTSPIYIDDVFVTGICAQKAGVKPEHSDYFYKKHILKKACLLKDAFAVFDVTNEEMRRHYAILQTYSSIDVCGRLPNFSAIRWLLDWISPHKNSPFSYRKTCK